MFTKKLKESYAFVMKKAVSIQTAQVGDAGGDRSL